LPRRCRGFTAHDFTIDQQAGTVGYPADHFQGYFPPLFDQLVADQVGFLRRHLKVDAPDRSRGVA